MRRTGNSMRSLISLAIIGIVFVCSIGVDLGGHSAKAAPVADDCDWTMRSKNPQCMPYADDECGPGDITNLKLAYSYNSKKNNEYSEIDRQPIAAEGKLFFTSTNGYLNCTDKDLNEIWSVKCDTHFSTPCYYNKKVIIPVSDGLVCYNSNDGSIAWNLGNLGDSTSSDPIIADNKLLLANDFGVYAVNPDTGIIIWKTGTNSEGRFFNSISSDGQEYVLAGFRDGLMECYNLKTGSLVWSKNFGGDIISASSIENQKAYFSNSQNVFCLNIKNGSTIWKSSVNDDFEISPLIYKNMVIIGGYENSYLYSFNKDTGEEIWRNNNVGTVFFGSFGMVYKNKLFLNTGGVYLLCFDPVTQEVIWRSEPSPNNRVYEQPLIAYNRLYIPCADGYLYCYSSSGNPTPPSDNNQPDNQGPTIVLVTPASDFETMVSGPNKLLFKVTDPSGITEVLVNGITAYLDGLYWIVYVHISNGKNIFVIKAKDKSANKNETTFNLTIIGVESNPISITPTSLSYGTVNRGKSSLKSINLTFNTTSVLKGTVTCDKRWIEISPTSFDSNAGSLSIVCKIEASKLPGKAGEQTANITIDYYDIFGLNSPGRVRPSGQIVVPITISTEQTIDLDLKVKRSYAYIGKLKVDLGYPPFLKNGRLLVPIRFVSESFGCSVEWEPTQKMVTIKRFDEVIIMWEGKKNIIVNGVEKVFDCPPVNSKNTTFVPIRVISEAFNASLQWFHKEQRLECKYLPPDDGY